MSWLECVPNLSEGRRGEVIDRLAAAVARPGVKLLDRSSDPDHNRTVLTLAGRADDLVDALLALYRVALEQIDLGAHEGVHPRVGAVDVVPFVPLGETPMELAVDTARRLAGEVGERFSLPVFLYGEAAGDRRWRELAAIRRGGLEGLAERMADGGWTPDFGPPHLHPSAGATVIGARFFLIAFNALLDTAELAVARRIARRIRASSGGLPAVKAIGVYLPRRRRAQVSMNLVDFRRTSLATTMAAVRREAAALGARVLETELVGLAPEAAILDAAAECLGLPRLTADHLVERRLGTL